MIQTKSGHAHGGADNPFGGRSPADPVYDRFWSIVNEAGVRLAVHLGGTDYQKYGADWSEDPEAVFGDFDAFQWMMYWGDRPAMELTSALDPAQLLRPVPEHQGVPVGDGHRVAALHAAQDGPRVPDGPQGEVGRERPARPRARRRSSASTSSWRRTRRRTCSGWWPRSASSRSCSAPTSPTARAWPTPPSTSRPSCAGSPRTTKRIIRDNLEDFLVAAL